MNCPRLLITESDRFHPVALDRLREAADVTVANLDRRELLRTVGSYDALWVRLRHRIDAEVLERASSLRWIASPTTGLNHIDLEMANRRGIDVISLRGETDFLRDIRATAEHTIGLMLAALRHLPTATAHVNSGGWNRDLFCGSELYQKTIGIVGFGRLGTLVAKYARGFDVRVLAFDPYVADDAVPNDIQRTPLETLLAESDIVTIHVNLSAETRGLFGRDQFNQMRRGSWLINTSRGEVIDESALLEALLGGHLRGAALDVLADESASGMRDHPLVRYTHDHTNLIITPHLGGCTAESMAKTEMFLAEKLCAALLASSLSA